MKILIVVEDHREVVTLEESETIHVSEGFVQIGDRSVELRLIDSITIVDSKYPYTIN